MPIFLPLIIQFLKDNIVSVTLGVLLCFSAVGLKYYKHRVEVLTEENNRFTALVEAQTAEKKRIEDGSKQVAVIITKDYEKKLANLRKYYANLTIPLCTTDGLQLSPASDKGSVSDSPKSVNGTAPHTLSFGDCAATTQQLESLQDWIIKEQELWGK